MGPGGGGGGGEPVGGHWGSNPVPFSLSAQSREQPSHYSMLPPLYYLWPDRHSRSAGGNHYWPRNALMNGSHTNGAFPPFQTLSQPPLLLGSLLPPPSLPPSRPPLIIMHYRLWLTPTSPPSLVRHMTTTAAAITEAINYRRKQTPLKRDGHRDPSHI